jgi:hypothetical protein
MELKRANRFAVLCLGVLAVLLYFNLRKNFQTNYLNCRDNRHLSVRECLWEASGKGPHRPPL